MPARLISIIGPPASGKTTLAERLSDELPAEMIREDYAGNPFLARSYEGDPKARLPGQIYFLMSRVGQLHIASAPPDGLQVSDYGFCQDRIYARQRLSSEDYRLYDRLAGRLEGLVRRPDVLVRLDAPEEMLLERIARRGMGFERVMDAEFLKAMRQAYAQAASEASCPVLCVDCGRFNLLLADVRQRLIERLREFLSCVKEAQPCLVDFR